MGLSTLLLVSCGGGTSVPNPDAAAQPCTDDNQCPVGQTCQGGFCQATSEPDAAIDRPAPSKMSVNPTLLDFGSPYVGGEYTKSFQISNIGASLLTVTTLNLIEDRTNGAFILSAPSVPFTVAPSDNVTITVVLRPNDENLPTGSVKVHSDDPDPTSADATVDLVSHSKGSGRLGVCVRNSAPPPDCTVSTDGNPLIDYGTLDYGSSDERVVALTNAGDGNLPIDITEVSLTDATYFVVTLFALVDDPNNPGQKIEQATTLPFFLSAGDPGANPPTPATELRVHVRFTAVGIDGDVPHESLQVKYNLPESPTTVPIVGKIRGCKPYDTDAGLPDGGADPMTDPNNCGTCGNRCTTAHGTPTCAAGQCQTGSCDTNYADCNTDPADGCESDLRVTSDHCGQCSTSCVNPHGTTYCSASTCWPSCAVGYKDCDSKPWNGCEADVLGDKNNCGDCGLACTNPHGTTLCVAGECKPNCAAGWASCDGDPSNGCETNTQVDVDHCGDCLKQCTNPGGSVSCVGGACVPGCGSGKGDCDGHPENGCETDILTDLTHCGSCTNACTNQHGSTVCTAGACVPSCSTGYRDCDGNANNGCETNIQVDGNNCGACGTVCTNPNGTTSCGNGLCVPSCASGWGDCNSNPVDGCETALTTTSNCGTCGRTCTNNHGSTTCQSGVCSPTCQSGWADCDTNKDNGCETDLSSLGNCGSCGNACTNAHGNTSCDGTKCQPICLAGYADCNGNLSDGCETDLSAVTYCGTCTQDAQCVSGFFCNGSQCEKKRVAGATCSVAKECSSNFCVDGRCCQSQCDTACRSCANATGSCNPVVNADDVPQCQGTMTCDANANCLKKSGQACTVPSECASGFCKDGVCCPVACDTACKSCATGACLPVANADDAPECTGASTCDASGNCRKKVGQACTTGGDCVTGFCKDGVCCDNACTSSCKSCVTGSCATVTNADDAPECTGTNTCDGSGNCKKKNGQACGGATECASGFCKDGFCCNSLCDTACRSCTTGTCTVVSSADDAPECTGNVTCDATGSCKKKNGQGCSLGTECSSGFCKDGVCCSSACTAACNNCSTGTCTQVKNAEDSPECSGSYTCDGSGICRLKGGQTCSSPGDCSSGFCKDGSCCNSACTDACFSCSTGTCTPVTSGDDSPECTGTSTCDTTGTCKKKNGQTCASGGECASGFCKDGVCCGSACTAACQNCSTGTCTTVTSADDSPECTGANTCDTAGVCKKKIGQACGAASECASGFCKDSVCCTAACNSACQSCAGGTCHQITGADDNPECTGTMTCDSSGVCKKKTGETCSSANECASGFCKDGRCCNAACTAACLTCSTGTCLAVANGDDSPECTGNYTCDSTAACKLKGGQTCTAGTQCATGFCKDGVCCNSDCTTACRTCVTGTCTVVASVDDDPECTGNNTCNASGVCLKKTGQACTLATECASGFCKDGKCCNAACTAACLSCSTGSCTAVTNADDNPECTGNNTCNASGVCLKKNGQACALGTECATGFCKDGKCCDTTCDTACKSCATGTCTTVTSADDSPECTGTNTCDASGVCKKKTGQPCAVNSECALGICKDNMCCPEACTAACKSCATGSCVTVTSADDNPECMGASTCDSSGACKKKNGQSCAAASECSSGFCKDSVCCNSGCTAACYSCASGTCTQVTNTDDNPECTGSTTCDASGACKKKNGQSCGAGTECATGFCKDGKCCNSACNLACQTCASGTCVAVTNADDNPECTGTNTCDATGNCDKKTGQTCSSGGECVTGYCKDGKCCDTACDTACKTCATGTCANVTSADDSPECTGVNTCSASGACLLKNGQSCTAAAQCSSNFCKDGVCCNSACTAQCYSCSTGTCTVVQSADDPPECSGSYTCDASGTCKLKAGQTCSQPSDCISGFCKDGMCCNEACTAACKSCATGTCTTVANADDSPECTGNYTCNGSGSCLLKTGQSCSSGGQCASGVCKDGKCCNTACDQACQTCASGTCGAVVSADDNPECTGNYTCNGSGSCLLKNGQTCSSAAQCASNQCKDGKCCDQACTSACQTCATGACTTVINGDDSPECTGNYTCNGSGACLLKSGQSCTGDGQCATGVCKDGKCCNQACNLACQTCASGTCASVTGGDDNPECTGSYTCDGSGQCKKKAGQPCSTASDCASNYCKDGVCCNNACSSACYSCATGSCTQVLGADDNPECTGTQTCSSAGVCLLKDGQGCSNNSQCAHGNCKDGVCCNTACNAACQTCTTGTCAAVLNADDNPECTGAYTCNGSGACLLKTGQSCTLATQCASGYCKDGACCVSACTTACRNCATGSCLNVTGAEDNPECMTTQQCDSSANCKKKTGQGCGGDTECLTGHCCSGTCRDLTNDTSNCGGCGTTCTNGHGSTACVGGVCSPSCTGTWGNCDGLPNNGCETDTSSNANNCGGCGIVCGSSGHTLPHTSTYGCAGSTCTVNTCDGNYYNVDGSSPNGCECLDQDIGNKACNSAINISTGMQCEPLVSDTCCWYYFDWYDYYCYYAGSGYLCTSDDISYCGSTYACNTGYGTPYTCNGVDDNGKSTATTGNIPYAGGQVWYVFQALNTHWDRTSYGGANPFNLKIGFTTNPGDAYQLQVYIDCNPTAASCPEDGTTPLAIHSTMPTDQWEFNVSSENPCVSSSPYSGYRLCQDHGHLYYVKVTLRGSPTCQSFGLSVTNGV